jgi:hypothetical protein
MIYLPSSVAAPLHRNTQTTFVRCSQLYNEPYFGWAKGCLERTTAIAGLFGHHRFQCCLPGLRRRYSLSLIVQIWNEVSASAHAAMIALQAAMITPTMAILRVTRSWRSRFNRSFVVSTLAPLAWQPRFFIGESINLTVSSPVLPRTQSWEDDTLKTV